MLFTTDRCPCGHTILLPLPQPIMKWARHWAGAYENINTIFFWRPYGHLHDSVYLPNTCYKVFVTLQSCHNCSSMLTGWSLQWTIQTWWVPEPHTYILHATDVGDTVTIMTLSSWCRDTYIRCSTMYCLHKKPDQQRRNANSTILAHDSRHQAWNLRSSQMV